MGPRTKYFTNIHKHKSQVQFDKKLGPTGSRTRGLVVNCIQHCIKPCNINLRPTHIDVGEGPRTMNQYIAIFMQGQIGHFAHPK